MTEKNAVIKLTKHDIDDAYWRWMFFSHSCYNYERLQATGVVQAFAPIIKKLYKNKPEEFKACILRHMQFFNTEPHFGGVILGITLAMEEQRANGAPITDEAINGVKTGLMGPFAGIGDTLWQGTIFPILIAFGISLGSQGNLLGPISFVVLGEASILALAYFSFSSGYKLGAEGVEKVLSSNILQKIITGASALGAIVLGAMSASFVSVKIPVTIAIGEMQMNLQTDVFDKLFKGILPLALTLFTLWLLKDKKMKANNVMLILVLIGAVGGLVGFLG